MELRTVLYALLVLGISATSNAAPAVTGGRCANHCIPAVNPKFNYAQGKVYVYNYESDTEVEVVGAIKEQPNYKVKATAEFHATSACELVLKLTNVQLTGAYPIPNSADFKKSLEERNLLFAHSDGHVDNVCADAQDPAWVVNFKRAIVSAFQNSIDNKLETHVREVDVTGICTTHYTVEGNAIIKTKDLLSCTNRVGNSSAIQADHYASHSTIQTAPVLDSDYRCSYTLSDSISKQVACHEVHRYRVHAKGDKAATITSDVKLTHTKTAKSSIKLSQNWVRTSLLFDHHDENAVKADLQDTNNVLKTLCQNYAKGEIGDDAAHQFTRLVYLFRRLSFQQLKTLYQSLPTVCPASVEKLRSTFQGALLGAATDESVAALSEPEVLKDVNIHRIHLWSLQYAFIKNPSIKLVGLGADYLAASKDFDSSVELSVSSFIHSYCRHHTDCQNEPALQKYLNLLGSRLQGKCLTNSDDEEDKIVTTLKAFGNVGRVGTFAQTIIDCAKNPKVRVPLRLAAIEAFRRVPADDNAGYQLLKILRDPEQDTEVRIAAYLALTRHPIPVLYDKIRDLLEHETVNQVSSFIWTHLHNLQYTASPLKREARELAEDIHFQKKFHNDIRKFSRNYDASFFSERYNVGSDLEANVIFSPNSYLPRSLTVNYTATVFGMAINLFEFDIRTENFEYLLEKYFGPAGKVRTTDRQELIRRYRERWHRIAQNIEKQAGSADHTEHHRRKRELPYKTQKLRELQDKAAFRPSQEPKGSVSLKVFGNELKNFNFHKLEDIYDRNDPYHFQDIFNQLAKHKELDLTRNWLFFDGLYSVPTASGFPLRLDLNGTLSAGLKLVSHFDVRKFLLRPRSADIKSLIQPSANIELSTALLLDAHVSKTGIRFQQQLYSSGAIDGTFQLKEGESLVANLDFPTPSQKILQFRSKSFVVQNDLETPVTPVNPNKYEIHGCSGGNTGLQLCSDVSLPKPLFDDSRPFATLGQTIKYDLILKKKDEGLKGFHFTALWKHEKDGEKVKNAELKLSFDTPGSSVNREVTVDYQFNRVDRVLRLNLKSPVFKVGVNGNYVNEPTKKEANFKVNINEREYSLNGKTTVDDKGATRIYDVAWEIKHPNAAPAKLGGKIIRTMGKKIEFDLKTDAGSDRTIILKGFVQRDGELHPLQTFASSADIHLVIPIIDVKLVGTFNNVHEEFGNKHKLDLSVDYTLKSDGKKSNFIAKLDQEAKLDREAHEFKFKRDFEFRSTRFPQCNVQSKFLIEKVNQQYHSLIDAKWGEDFNDVNKKVFYEHTHKYKLGARGAYEGQGLITFIYPKRNINWKIDSKIEYLPGRQLEYDLELKYGQDKTIKLAFDYKNQTAVYNNYEIALKLDLPSREIVLKDKYEEKANGEHYGQTYIQWQKGEYVTINSSFKDKGTGEANHYEAEVIVLFGTQPNPIRKYKLVYHGEPKKHSLTGRVDRPDASYTVDAVYDTPAPGSANFNLNLKLPWIEGLVNSKRVPNDFQGKVDLKTYKGRKIIGSASLKGDAVKNLAADLKWDAGRDDSQKFSLKAEVERPRRKAAKVKGTLTLPNQTVKGSFNYELPQTFLTGPHKLHTDLEYGQGKRFAVDANINIDRSQTGRRKSHGEITYSSHYIQNWKLNYDTDFHNHPEERSFEAHFDVNCPKHGHYGFEVDYLRGYKKLSSAIEVQYGDGKAIRLGSGIFHDIGGHGHGYDIGGRFELKTPFPGFEDCAITLRDAFHHSPETGHFVTDHHVRWAPGKQVGLTVEYNRVHKEGESLELSGKIEVDTPFTPHRKLEVDINFDRDPIVSLHANINAESGDTKKVETHLHYTRDGAKIDSSLEIDGRKTYSWLYITGTFVTEPHGDGNYHTHTSIKDGQGGELTIHGEITATEAKKTADITVTYPAGGGPKTATVKGQVTRDGTKRTADVTATWGPGQNINFKSDLTLDAAGSFKGDVKVNSEALGLKDISVGVERKLGAPKRSYSVYFNFGPDREIELVLDVTDKPDKTGITGDGSVIINGDEFITTKINVIDSPTKANHWGRLLQYSAEVHNPAISFATTVVLLSNKGINPTFKLCSLDGKSCIKWEGLLDLDRWDPTLGPIDNTVYAKVTVQDAPGKSRTLGVEFKTSRVRANKEASLKFLLNEEENRVFGFTYKKERKDEQIKSDTKKVYQIILPTRTLEARSERKYSAQGYVYTLHLLSDAVKAPNKEILLTSDVKRTQEGDSITRNTKITIKHPKFSKDLIVLSNIKIKTGKAIFTQKLEVDVSKDPKKKILIEIELLDDPRFNNGHNYTFLFGLRQAAKNLDFKLKGHYGRAREARTVGLDLNWLTRANQQYVISFFNDLNRVQKTVHGHWRSPLRQIAWDGHYQKYDDGGLALVKGDIDLLYNNKVVRSASVEYSRGPQYNIKYYIHPEDKTRLIRFHGGVLDEYTYRWTVTRVKAGQQTQDIDIYHHLNNTHLLYNRYSWRPELLNEIRDAIDNRLDGYTDALTDVAQNFFSKAGDEVLEKTAGIQDIFKTDLGPFFAFIKEKVVTIGTELKNDWQPLKLTKLRAVLKIIFSGEFLDTDEIVNRLEKRLENVHAAIGNAFTTVTTFLSHLDEYSDKFREAIRKYFDNLPERIQAFRTNLRARLPEIADRVRNFLIRVRDAVDDFVTNEYVSKALAKFREVWDKTFGRFRELIDAVLETILGSGDGKDGLYDRVKGRLYELAEGDSEAAKTLKGILLAIKSVKEKVKEVFSDICRAYEEYREEAFQRFTALYNSADPDLKELIAEIRAYRQKLLAKYQDDRSLKERIRAFVDKALGLAKEHIHEITSTSVFDPKNGLIKFYIPLILPAESIRTLRTQGFTLQRLIQREKISTGDVYRRIKRALTSGDILPPFEAHAILIGDQHFVTYDNRFYDFLGKCSYVLTTDLVDRNFTVIVNYGEKQGKAQQTSIVIISDTHHVEIKPDYKVLLDEQEVELPNQIENTHIHREFHAITVENNKGFTLVYDIEHNLVKVNVSGFYFNRLGGLFGNYNNEPNDDFHTPEGLTIQNPTVFANSWEVSNRCAAKDNFASEQEALFGSKGYLWCHKLFSSDWSPFKKCFPYAPASHYLRACLEEVSIRKDEAEPAETACRVASAFIDHCHHENIHLELPAKCLRCSRPDGTKYGAGDVQTLKGNEVPKSADVIFIVEQKECNRRILLDSLDEVAKDLDKELQANGLTNNQYGIVAFGGEGVQSHAHSHTARGQLFTDARSVVLALKNLGFSGTSPSDAFEAIELATSYPFRTGVAKTAVLFLCNRCSDDHQSVDYYDLQHHLLQLGISLHILTTEETTIKTKPQVAQQTIGYDAQTTFRAKDTSQKTLTGDKDVRPHIVSVDDVCYRLAQELDGSVFRSDQLSVKKGNVGKNVRTVFSRRVVASAKPQSCQKCDCIDGPDDVPIPVCSPCTEWKPKTVR